MQTIEPITRETALCIIDTRSPQGLFLFKDRTRQKPYVGIDNTTRDAWIEEFAELKDCLRWLTGICIEVDRLAGTRYPIKQKIDKARELSEKSQGARKTPSEMVREPEG